MNTTPYIRKAHYHETDQMGMIYHANYIRWFEEARVDFMEQLGTSYKTLEDNNIFSPVTAMHAEYKMMVRFDDIVLIYVCITKFTGSRMAVQYKVVDKKTGQLRCIGHSEHCFLSKEGRPVSLKKTNPQFYDFFDKAVGINQQLVCQK